MNRKIWYCILVTLLVFTLTGCDFESWNYIPVITPNGGVFSNSVEISITSPASDWDVYYSIGRYNYPEYDGILYTEPFTITKSTTIKAIAIEREDRFFFENRRTEIVTAEFTVNPSLGSRGPAGGIVIYDKGFETDGWRFIEAAPFDQVDSMIWAPQKSFLGSTFDDIGKGKANTEEIYEHFGSAGTSSHGAAELCYELTLNGYSDWYLPSIAELKLMQNYQTQLGIENYHHYWSSTEKNFDYAKLFLFITAEPGTEHYDSKYSRSAVRAIRYF